MLDLCSAIGSIIRNISRFAKALEKVPLVIWFFGNNVETYTMTSKNPVPSEKNKQNHSKHMWMMVLCCGIPIVALLAIAMIGISAPSLETFLFLVCPIGMVGMMYMMHRDGQKSSQSHSCCTTDNKASKSSDEVNGSADPSSIKLPQSGSLKA
jgi:hypothetical protein